MSSNQDSPTQQRVRELVAPLLADDLTLYDVEYAGGTLRIAIDRPGGVDLEAITTSTRAISAALDEADAVSGSYTLEVSSPGLERRLRTIEHFEGAIGEEVRIKVRPGTDGDRRAAGRLTAVDAERRSITVDTDDGSERTIALDDVTRAQVHVDWTPPPKPGSSPTTTPRSEATS